MTRDRQAGAARPTAGQIELVTASGWGLVGRWLTSWDEVGQLGLLAIDGTGFQRVPIRLARLVLTQTYQVEVLLGSGSIKPVATRLFRDLARLKPIGPTAAPIAAGFCRRGHLAAGPLPTDTLAEALERLRAGDLETVLDETVGRLVRRGGSRTRQGHFASEAGELETTRRYLAAGLQAITERQLTEREPIVEIGRYVPGFQVLLSQEARPRLVGAAEVAPLNAHEPRHTPAPVRQAADQLGPGVPRVVLIGAGFLEGEARWTRRHELALASVAPSQAKRHVTGDARPPSRRPAERETTSPAARPGEARPRRAGTRRGAGRVTAVGGAGRGRSGRHGPAAHAAPASRQDVGATPIDAGVVTRWAGRAWPPGEEPGFLTGRPGSPRLTGPDWYDRRGLIEHTAVRELEQGGGPGRFPKKTPAAVGGHVPLTVLTFTLSAASHPPPGPALTRCGSRRQRAETAGGPVIIVAGEPQAIRDIFDIEEVFILLGGEPAPGPRVDPAEVRRRHGLPPRPSLRVAA